MDLNLDKKVTREVRTSLERFYHDRDSDYDINTTTLLLYTSRSIYSIIPHLPIINQKLPHPPYSTINSIEENIVVTRIMNYPIPR